MFQISDLAQQWWSIEGLILRCRKNIYVLVCRALLEVPMHKDRLCRKIYCELVCPEIQMGEEEQILCLLSVVRVWASPTQTLVEYWYCRKTQKGNWGCNTKIWLTKSCMFICTRECTCIEIVYSMLHLFPHALKISHKFMLLRVYCNIFFSRIGWHLHQKQ